MNSEIHIFGIQFQQFLSSFDQQSARDIDTRVPSSFKCTFTLLIFRPHSPSFSFFAKLLLTWLEMKKCNFQEEEENPRDFQLNGSFPFPRHFYTISLCPRHKPSKFYIFRKRKKSSVHFSLIYVTEHRWKNTISQAVHATKSRPSSISSQKERARPPATKTTKQKQ